MYIEPNSTIRLLKNCPLDTSYDHTLWFPKTSNKRQDQLNQADYFMSLTKNYGRTNEFSFSKQYYARATKGSVRLQKCADECFDCNYMMFKNTAYGDKWFYAYIVSIDFINNITCQINFEIDPMQTWYFDYTLGQCFVEREHADTDEIGDNLVPEGLETGDYVNVRKRGTDLFGNTVEDWCYIVVASFDKDGDDAVGMQYQGVYSGLKYNFFETYTEVNDFLSDNAQKALDGVVSILQIPRFMLEDYEEEQFISVGHTIDLGEAPTTIGDYTPRNNKLLTYPYNFLYVTNNSGNSAVYHYEYFYYKNPLGDNEVNTNPVFILTAGLNTNPTFSLVPRSYKFQTEVGLDTERNTDERLTLSGLPQCAYNVDFFKAWLAQNASSMAVNTLASAVGYSTLPLKTQTNYALSESGELLKNESLTPASSLMKRGAIAGGIVGVGRTLSQVYQASIRPPQAHGEQGSVSNVNFGLFDFTFYFKQIRPEFARIIDDYFTMFGYACHKCKVPNTHVRERWTYTKTINCVVHGSVPSDDMKRITDIYNAGITFWVNPDDIGHYNRSNNII